MGMFSKPKRRADSIVSQKGLAEGKTGTDMVPVKKTGHGKPVENPIARRRGAAKRTKADDRYTRKMGRDPSGTATSSKKKGKKK